MKPSPTNADDWEAQSHGLMQLFEPLQQAMIDIHQRVPETHYGERTDIAHADPFQRCIDLVPNVASLAMIMSEQPDTEITQILLKNYQPQTAEIFKQTEAMLYEHGASDGVIYMCRKVEEALENIYEKASHVAKPTPHITAADRAKAERLGAQPSTMPDFPWQALGELHQTIRDTYYQKGLEQDLLQAEQINFEAVKVDNQAFTDHMRNLLAMLNGSRLIARDPVRGLGSLMTRSQYAQESNRLLANEITKNMPLGADKDSLLEKLEGLDSQLVNLNNLVQEQWSLLPSVVEQPWAERTQRSGDGPSIA